MRSILPLFSFVALTSLTAVPSAARADTGHVALLGGALTTDAPSGPQWMPHARTELAFRLWGPFELGGYLEAQALDLAMQQPSFGGGLLVALRPDMSFFGFVPSAEVAGSRITLPSDQGRAEGWGVSVGAGVGYELAMGLGFEVRLRHQWNLELPTESGIGESSWSVTAGVTYRLP